MLILILMTSHHYNKYDPTASNWLVHQVLAKHLEIVNLAPSQSHNIHLPAPLKLNTIYPICLIHTKYRLLLFIE